MVTDFKRSLRAQVTGVQRLGGVRGSFWAWPSVDLQEEPVVSLGNALPTEAATASVDSCPVLREGTEWEKGSFIARRMDTGNVSGDSSSMNQAEAQHADSDGPIHPPGEGKKEKSHFSES